MQFKININEGIRYSKLSGDTNKIHLNNLSGYNSIFGERICHGCLVIKKFFKTINIFKKLNNKYFSIEIIFKKYFKYNENIKIKKKKNKYFLYQTDNLSASIEIRNKLKLSNIKFNKKKYSQKLKKNINKYKLIQLTLNEISKYVGTIYPGKYSILNKIIINSDKRLNPDLKKIEIYSKKISPKFPFIINKLLSKELVINFDTLERPKINLKKTKPKSVLLKKINNINEKILILGASQGIGKDILHLTNYNKKILKIATYNKNLINLSNTKIIKKKIDIKKNLNNLNKIISKHSSINIYYFATPKIFFDKKLEKSIVKEYKEFFINIPIKIIKQNKNKNIKFFYPSTTNINLNNKSIYSKIKLEAEKKIKNICLKYKIPFLIYRFPAINSRQSITLSNTNPPNLITFLNHKENDFNKIFFK
tara:strand:- start:6235 stop:7497 length:1263 start_codon:yes stop_codon:yes gene_type:complete